MGLIPIGDQSTASTLSALAALLSQWPSSVQATDAPVPLLARRRFRSQGWKVLGVLQTKGVRSRSVVCILGSCTHRDKTCFTAGRPPPAPPQGARGLPRSTNAADLCGVSWAVSPEMPAPMRHVVRPIGLLAPAGFLAAPPSTAPLPVRCGSSPQGEDTPPLRGTASPMPHPFG